MHKIFPEEKSLHGHFDSEREPAITVDLGDTVEIQTLDVAWGMEQHNRETMTRLKFTPRPEGHGDGPAFAGPIAIRDIKAGESLAIHLEEIRPMTWGWSWGGGKGFLNRPWNQAFGVEEEEEILLLWTLDPEKRIASSEDGHQIAMRPFLGCLGLAPAGKGKHTGWHPRRTGGNMDCSALVAGSIVHLPVEVDGGLLSLGDGHAHQADGELGGTAIECRMECVRLRVERSPYRLRSPFAETPDGWVTLGFGKDLDEAAKEATNTMLDLLCHLLPVSRSKIIALASVFVDLRITQVVNQIVGVHAFLSHTARAALFAPYST